MTRTQPRLVAVLIYGLALALFALRAVEREPVSAARGPSSAAAPGPVSVSERGGERRSGPGRAPRVRAKAARTAPVPSPQEPGAP